MTEKKTLSLEEFRNIYVENATIAWMKRNNMDPSDPNTNSVELDLSIPDSQMSMAKENFEEAFDELLNTMAEITSRGYDLAFDEEDEDSEAPHLSEEDKEEIQGWLDEQLGNGRKFFAGKPIPELKAPTSAVTKGSAMFIFLESAPGISKTVADVREWLAEVDNLGIPDDKEIDGQLYLDYDLDVITTERSECLYCGNEDDVLMTLHECTAGEEDI